MGKRFSELSTYIKIKSFEEMSVGPLNPHAPPLVRSSGLQVTNFSGPLAENWRVETKGDIMTDIIVFDKESGRGGRGTIFMSA